MADVRSALLGLLGTECDDEIVEYVCSSAQDPLFEWEEAADIFGPLLVGGGVVADDAAAAALCDQLHRAVLGDAAGGTAANGRAAGCAAAAPAALAGGPVLMDELNRVALHPSDAVGVSHLIQGAFREGEADDFSLMSERDAAKLRKAREREERGARAAYEAHAAAAAAALAGDRPAPRRRAGAPPAPRDLHLRVSGLTNGGAELVEDSDVLLAHGRRYGLVGRNGTGKTTLLRALAAGDVAGVPDGCSVLHVEQEVAGGEASVLDAVLACDGERAELLAAEARLMAVLGEPGEGGGSGGVDGDAADEAARAAAAEELAAVSRALHESGADAAPARAAAILAGLGFDAAAQARTTASLSGGWRMRVALARALFAAPDLLLLDEPTNHLDLHAVLWLEDHLLRWPGTLVVVSHARSFLNAVCTDVLHLHGRAITAYRGDFDTFERTLAERTRNARAAGAAAEARRAHMQAFIDQFRYNANRAALVQSRVKALERMAEVAPVEEDPEYRFSFPSPGGALSPPVLSFSGVAFGYPGGPELYRDLDFGLDLGSRLAIVGPNGAGKSTLLKLIAGELAPTRGAVHRSPAVRLAVFSQHHVDGLDLALTPLAYFARCFPGSKEPERRAQLASFGVGPELAAQAMYTLSGGQKSRVALARVTWPKPHILLLDEPSNHLDLDAVDALIRGLTAFEGGVLMVSHDEHLISATVDELWAVDRGTIRPFHGTFEDYKRRLRPASGPQ